MLSSLPRVGGFLMKKVILGLLFILFMTPITPRVFAWSEEPSTHGPLMRSLMVEGRALLNLSTCVLEIPRTTGAEIKKHPKVWPFTFMFRSFTNLVTRIVSGACDMGINPVYVLFTRDTRPLTQHFGLPDYAWQEDEENF